MDFNLRKENINYAKIILNTSFTQEETMEMIVPDALPDILRVADTDATVLLRTKEADTGRVSVSGVIGATILYAPDGLSGVRKMELNIPFNAMAADAEISSSSKVVAHVSVTSIDSSIINPRKILVRAEILVSISCYNDMMLSVCAGVEEEKNLEVLTASRELYAIEGIREKTFIISDELSLPGSNPPIDEILKTKVHITVNDAKIVGNKLIFRGDTNISVLYRPEGGGEMTTAEFSSEYSQIAEFDNVPENCDFEIKIMLTGAYFNTETAGESGRVIATEINAVAQCVAAAKREITFIADAYSTNFALDYSVERLDFNSKLERFTLNDTFREGIDTATEVKAVLSANARAGAVSVSVADGKAEFKTTIFISGIYISDDGRIMPFTRKFEAQSSADAKVGHMYSAEAICGKELYATPSGNSIEVRVPVDFMVTETYQECITAIDGISCDEEAALDISGKPSLIIHRAILDDTIWKLAKNHHSTKELILSANEIENEEKIVEGSLLIIPKRR